MKKLLILLGLIGLMFFASAPRVAANDIDIGSELRAQSAVPVVMPDFQTADLSFECVTVIATRDPGSMLRLRSACAATKSRDGFNLSNAELNNLNLRLKDRQCARVYDTSTRYNVTPDVFGTSNGGPGY